MKNLIKFGGLLALVLTGIQTASAQSSHDGFYMGLDGSYDDHEPASITIEQNAAGFVPPSTAVYVDDGIAAGVFVGYRQSYDRLTVAAEARYTYSFVKNEPTATNTFNPTNEFGASVLPGFWLGDDVLVFGRLGFSQLTTNRNFQGVLNNNSDTGIIYGGGIEFYLNDQMSVRADYTRAVYNHRMMVDVNGSIAIFTNDIRRQRIRGSLIYKF